MSNRSGSPYSAPTDADRRPVMLGVSTVDGITPVPLEVNPSTGQLQTSSSGGGGGGTSSSFNATFPATGTAIGASNGTNMLPLLVDGSGYLEVNVKAGSGSGLSVTDEATFTAGTSNFVPAGGTYNTSNATLTNGQQGIVNLTSNRGFHSNLRNALGVEIGTSTTPLVSEISDSTNIANVVAGDTGFNGIAVNSGTKTLTFTTSIAGAQTLLANTNVEGYSWIEVVYTSVGAGLALTGQFSTVSGGTYTSPTVWGSNSGPYSSALGIVVNTNYSGPVRGNFFQLNVTALTSGTFSGTVTLRAVPPTSGVVGANQSGTWTVGSNSATGNAVPANAFYTGMLDAGGNLIGIGNTARQSDASTATTVIATSQMNYNGTTFDRQRSANGAANTTGTGLLGVGNLIFDGTNWQKQTTTTAIGTVGTTTAVVNVGQQTVGTSAVQISASSTVPTNGIIIQALSTNSASIFVGGSGVTTSNGFEIQKGQAVSFTCNLNTLYIISAASTSDKICWNVE